MPELPEVQTTVKGLNKVLPGLVISNVWSDTISSFNQFKRAVTGSRIKEVGRRGKNILIYLSNNQVILIHMKMTGCLLYGVYQPGERFIHAIFSFSNKKQMAFSDLRKFGKIVLIKGEPLESPHLNHLGPEPLEQNFTFSKFKAILDKKPAWKIKTLLMDQTLIVGIGNIYSDEILWSAGVHPEEKEKDIPQKKFKVIFSSMKKVLKKSIALGGDSMSDYRNINGEKGKFQLYHRAYRRTGEKCEKNDGGVIIRKKLGGRSAHFCPVHQKLFRNPPERVIRAG
ncbi:MAG TPA: DNA-formamidopyrimidine glycosylase [Candidatus Paceibacterota bacterium]